VVECFLWQLAYGR